MKLRKSLCVILSLCMLFAIGQPAYALETENAAVATQYAANIAYVQDVNEKGTNLTSDTANNVAASISENYITVEQNQNNSINVVVTIANENVSISGVPAGRTDSGKTIFYTPTVSDARYEVVSFAYITDTSVTNMYFKGVKAEKYPSATSMLKIYLKDATAETLDYYFVESFDVDLEYSSDYVATLPVNPLLGAWAATQFQPVTTEFGQNESDISVMATSDSKTWYCTKTFYDLGEYQTHTISWRTNADYADVEVGRDATQYYRITVYAKSMSFTVNTDLNSSTESFLHVDGVRLCQSSIPNTAWKSTSIDGVVQDNSLFGGELSASIGVSLGPIDISYSIPLSFTAVGDVDIDGTYDSYENNVNGKFTRCIETEMDSDFKLTQIGHYFQVVSVLRDYENVTQSAKTLQAKWYVDIINLGTMETCSHTCTHNASVAITN